ncbi:MAG: hypothetical protein JW929_00010 [Anaerolineales bacterium]|nr:hypothetical protein [Anaerolineales bacterium]
MIERNMDLRWEDAIRAAVRVRDADPAFAARLRSELAHKAIAARPARPLRALRPAWTLAALLLALAAALLLLIGPEKVVAALQSLLGYVPGVGFVRMDQSFRILEHTVREERDGASLYVLQVLADEGRTVVVYEVDCPGPESQWLKTGTYCTGAPALELPGGGILWADLRAGRSDLTYYRERAEFPAVPPGTAEIVLRLPFRASPESPYESWDVTMTLRPAGGEATVYPVLETTSAAASPGFVDSDLLREGLTLALERIVVMPEEYYLQGSLAWDPARFTYAEADFARMEIQDNAGRLCPLEFAAPDPDAPAENRLVWAVRFNPQGHAGPYLLRIHSIDAARPAGASIAVDFGPAPKAGRTFWLGIPLRAAGYDLRVTSARFADADGSIAVVFTFRGPEDLVGASWTDADQSVLPYKGGGLIRPGEFESGAVYPSPPSGRRTIRVETLTVRYKGSWIIPFDVVF